MTQADSTKPKRLIVCCDGTWQSLANVDPTNVAKLAKAVKLRSDVDNIPQILYYDDGVGTQGLTERIMGGAFGKGLDLVIADAYRFLCMNYTMGDEIYLFGFSRGAYAVRSLAGLIYNCGILKRENMMEIPKAIAIYRSRKDEDHPNKGEQAQAFRDLSLGKEKDKDESQVSITLLGCWDTVGSLGIPDFDPYLPIDEIVNSKYRFHNTTLNPKIQNALHAVAIDEQRKVFDVTPMEMSNPSSGQTLRQVWFPGDHGCVGGGKARKDKDNNDNSNETVQPNPFAQITLQWMIDSIKDLGLGLEFNEQLIAPIPSDDELPEKFPFESEPKSLLDEMTKKLGTQDRAIEKQFKDHDTYNFLHKSVNTRLTQYPSYALKKLGFKDQLLFEQARKKVLDV